MVRCLKVMTQKSAIYELELDFLFKDLKYSGKERIKGEFNSPIKLNSRVDKINKILMDGKEVDFKHENDEITINREGKEIYIEFENRVSEISLMGIYKSITKDGYIITTQMEPTGARSFIPCFDDPSVKGIFKVAVSVDDPTLEVIFNTDATEDKVVNGKRIFKFRETPKMSTYLLYLGIGRFERISEEYKGKVLSVVTEPGKSKYGRFALDILKELLDQYEEYYEIKFPLKKLDLISINQFAAGAMENWGAITFRESLLLKTENTSFNMEKTIAKVISHELAHQWFGDLVTMKWWDDLWLNESFATFMGDKMVSIIRPDWKVDEEFINESLFSSMELDSLTTTHPISVEVRNPDEIAEIFDSISYGKGGSILRMIEDYMGKEEFRKGIVNYLNKYSYSNAEAQDLWNSLQEVSGKKISEIMKNWISKGGHPVVEIVKIPDGLKLTQSRFTYLNKEDDYIWKIPLKVSKGKSQMEFTFEDKKMVSLMDFDMVDPNVRGYYRVSYEEDSLERFLNKKRPSYQEGVWLAKVLDDYFAFALAKRIGLDKFIDIMDKISKVNNYVVIMRLLDIHGDLLSILDNEYLREILLPYTEKVLSEVEKGDDKNLKVLKERVATRLAQLSKDYRKNILNSKLESLEPEYRLAYFIALAKEGMYEQLADIIRRHSDEQDTVRAIQALTTIEDPVTLINYLDEIKERKDLRANLIYAIMGATRNPKFRNNIWDWINKNYEWLREIYAGSGYMSFMVESLISYAGIGNSQRVNEFLSKINRNEVKRGVENGLEWLKIHESLVEGFSRIHN